MSFYDGRILGDPVVTRRLVNTRFGPVEIQDVAIEVDNTDGAIAGDLRGIVFTMDLYNPVTGAAVVQGTFVVSQVPRSRGRATVLGTNLDLSALEALIPVGVATRAAYPLIGADEGKTAPWIFGNVANMPLLYVRDGVEDDTFDYLLGRGTVPAIRALRRLGRDTTLVPPQTFDVTSDELEPYPGMGGVLVNGNLEGWDAGATSVPDGWTLAGSGATVAKNITAGQVDEGVASASVTATVTVARLTQDLVANAPTLSAGYWQGREITVTARARATVASRAFIRIFDGVTLVDSAFHTGGGLFETLSADLVVGAAATSVTISVRVEGGATTAQFDDVRVYLRAKNLSECIRPDLYAGYSAIRPYTRQTDETGALYQLVGDLNGLQAERNLVRAARTILSDPDHGLGKTVDATTFDAEEIKACFTYEDAVRLDNPVLFLPFRDPVPQTGAASVTVHDRSSYANHGTAFNGGGGVGIPIALGGPSSGFPSPIIGFGNSDDAALAFFSGGTAGTYVSVPSIRAYSGQDISVELWMQIYAGNLPDATARPLVEKLVGTGLLSGYGLYRESNNLVFFVRGANATLYLLTTPLVDVTDEGRWLHVVCTATGGVMQIYRGALGVPAVLVATGSYAGTTIAEGDGEVLVGKFGTGLATPGRDWLDNIALYPSALSAGRIAAHTTAIALDAGLPVANYMQSVVDLAPSLFYYLGDAAGSATMFDLSGHSANGTFVGTPTLGVEGPTAQERGYINGWGAMRVANNTATYAVKTGQTLAAASGSVLAWVKPAAMGVNAGIVEKTIGGVRDTQWSLCQRRSTLYPTGVMRFTRVTTAGVFTVDVPLAPEDIGRWMLLNGSWRDSDGLLQLSKNGSAKATEGVTVTTTYTGTAVSGVGDLYIGVQGTNGAGLTRPGQGDIGRVSYHPALVPVGVTAALWLAATWYNGGLVVDAALLEQRQAQAWLRQILLLYGIRLGVSAAGAWTVTVDTQAAAPTVTLRDGPGDGVAPNLLDLRDRKRPALKDAIRDYVLKFRKDYLTGIYLCEQRYEVSTQLDASGNRIGIDWEEESEVLRAEPAASRGAWYLAQYAAADETVVALVEPVDGTPLFEGMRVYVIDPTLSYSGDTLQIRAVGKQLRGAELTLGEDPSTAFTWVPSAYPASPGPEA